MNLHYDNMEHKALLLTFEIETLRQMWRCWLSFYYLYIDILSRVRILSNWQRRNVMFRRCWNVMVVMTIWFIDTKFLSYSRDNLTSVRFHAFPVRQPTNFDAYRINPLAKLRMTVPHTDILTLPNHLILLPVFVGVHNASYLARLLCVLFSSSSVFYM